MVDKRPAAVRDMFASIAHRYDAANRVLSFSLDRTWRRRVATGLLPLPGRVLDLAAGTGDLSLDLRRWGHHDVVAADFTVEMLHAGRERLRTAARASVGADALALPFDSAAFNAATVAFGIRNFADPAAGLREIRRVLKPGGVCGILEFSRPDWWMAAGYGLYSRLVLPLVGGLITGKRAPYEYLPASVREFPEGDAFLALMKDAGFVSLTAARFTGGIVTFYRGVSP